jgi:putative heme transporter
MPTVDAVGSCPQTLRVRWPDWMTFGNRAETEEVVEARNEQERELELRRDEIAELSTAFAPPEWLEDAGRTSWLLVGLVLLLAGVILLLAETYTIVGPVVVAVVVATVAMPLVGGMQRRRIPRAGGAAIVILGVLAIAVTVLVLVLAGIKDQSGAISSAAQSAAGKASNWLTSVGVDTSSATKADRNVSTTVPDVIQTLSKGILSGIKGLTSIGITLSFLFLSLFFVLKDGPRMRAIVDRHLGVPEPVARTITGGVIRSLRGYFKGVTIVAAFNGVVIGLGALILGVPLAGTLAVVNFILAYIPYIGAFAGGAFAVVVALGAKGATTALIMLLIVILANGLLQNLVQPFAMGSALELNPLVVLVVTIGAGCLFGTIGLILAAPLVSAAVHIKAELDHARKVAALQAPTAVLSSPD